MDSQLFKQILGEMAASQLHQLLWYSAKWAVLGGLLGLVVGIGLTLLFKRIGWYQSGWRFAGWIRWPLWIACVAFCVVLAAGAGLCKGVSQGADEVLHKSQLATKVFPVVGNAIADGLAGLQTYAGQTNSTETTRSNVVARIEAFRTGEWELDVPLLQRQLEELSASAVSNIVVKIETNLVARSPQLQSGLPGALFHHALQFGTTYLVERKVHSELKNRKLDTFFDKAKNTLLAVARSSGNPDTITYPELSEFAVQEVVAPSVMFPIRVALKQQAIAFLLCTVLAAILPALAFRFTLGLIKAKAAQPVGVPPPVQPAQ